MAQLFAEIVNLIKMKKTFVIKCLIFLLVEISFGQNSLLEDQAGEGALKVNDNRIALNTSEESIKIDYFSGSTLRDSIVTYTLGSGRSGIRIKGYHLIIHDTVTLSSGARLGRLRFHPDDGLLWGLNLNVKANNGLTSILDGGKITFAGSIGAYCSIYLPQSNALDYINLSASLLSGKVDLLDTANILAGSYKQSFIGYRVEASYNRYGSIRMNATIFGISTSFKMSDNADGLDRKEYTRTTTILSSPSDIVIRQNKLSGFIQEEYIREQKTWSVNVDAGIYPHNTFRDRVLFATHIRSYLKEDDRDMIINAGIGAYLTKDGAPSKILGGVNFILQDVLQTVNTAPFNERIAINVVAGFRF